MYMAAHRPAWQLIALLVGTASLVGANPPGCGGEFGLDFELNTQADIDGLAAAGCTTLKSLTVLDSTITNFKGLEKITRIEGSLNIMANTALTSLRGLESISYLHAGLIISDNPLLTDLKGLDGLREMYRAALIINNNEALTSLEGLGALTIVDAGAMIYDNPNLPNFAGLASLLCAPEISPTPWETLCMQLEDNMLTLCNSVYWNGVWQAPEDLQQQLILGGHYSGETHCPCVDLCHGPLQGFEYMYRRRRLLFATASSNAAGRSTLGSGLQEKLQQRLELASCGCPAVVSGLRERLG